MKGVIFKFFEDFVVENFGDDVYDDILDSTELETKEPFVGPGTYPDGDLIGMVVSASGMLGISVDVAVKTFGKWMFSKLAAMTPQFVDNHTHPKDFLMTVEDVIHVEVNKLYKHAETPGFEYEDLGADKLLIIYSSKRKMFSLMEGLVEGVGDYFNYNIGQEFEEKDDKGYFTLTFSKK